MRKLASCLGCILLLTLMTQAGNVQAVELSASQIAEIQKEAEQGDAIAQKFLGSIYLKGRGVPQNSGKGVYWLQKSAEQGVFDAQFILGLIYYYGDEIDIPEDYAKAALWLQKAVEQDVADTNVTTAQSILGYIYASKKFAQQDDFEATKWWKKAADKGEADAQSMLGMFHLIGRGVIRDKQKGCGLIRASAEQGHKGAIESYNKFCAD